MSDGEMDFASGNIPSAKVLRLTLVRATRLLFGLTRLPLVLLILATVMVAVLPGIQLSETKKLVDAVAAHNSVNEVLLHVSLLSLTYILLDILGKVIAYISDIINLKLSLHTNIEIVSKTAQLEVQQYENADIYNKIQRADADTGAKIFAVFQSARSGVQSVVTISSVLVVIFSWSPLVALILLVAQIPAAVANARLASLEFEIEFSRAEEQRAAA